jgi:hypothetical protein
VPHLNSIAARAEALHPFGCSTSHGSLDSVWVHVAGALDIATTPQLEKSPRESHARLVLERYDAPLLRIAEEALVP